MASSSSSETVTCPYHPEATLIEDDCAGDLICSACALVVGDRVIDFNWERQTFSNKKSTSALSRVGDAQLSGSHRSLMNTSTEMADRRGVSREIQDKANELSNKVRKCESLKSRRKKAIAAACLYIACKQNGDPRTLKELSAICKISKKEAGRCLKLILKDLKISVDPITMADVMSQFLSQDNLNLPPNVRNAATHICNKAVDQYLVPGEPQIAVAAAATLMASQASGQKLSLTEIVRIAGMATITIRHVYRLIRDKAAELFPSDFEFTTPVNELPKL